MIVVSDATPLHALLQVGHIEVLSQIFDRVIAPPMVRTELTHRNTPPLISSWMAAPPHWFEIVTPSSVDESLVSGRGEREAIALALELRPDYLLVDDKEARIVAHRLELPVLGTLGVLELASRKHLVDFPVVVNRLCGIGFYIDKKVVQTAIVRMASSKPKDSD